jgi:GAF domain-containing protein
MPMRATTVRFSEDLWRLLEREAEREGVSAAQFIRDASVMRAAYAMGRRGDPAFEAAALAGNGGNGEGAAGVLGAEEARRLTAERAEEDARRRALLATAAAVQDPARLAALRSTGLLDSAPDPSFDRHVRLAAEVLNAPVALVSLIDEDRQFLKSCIGVEEPWASARETPLSHSFCQHTVAQREPLVVHDAREHPLLKDNPAITDMGAIAYAGVPLIEAGGHALGTLCVIDGKPRQWSRHQVELLSDLAASVVSEITLAGAS